MRSRKSFGKGPSKRRGRRPPATFSHDGESRRPDRKTMQLCGQVSDALYFALSGACHDDILRNLWVVSVEPAPDATHLLVTVSLQFKDEAATPARVLEHLGMAAGALRTEVAQAITRRRAPELSFRYLPPEAIVPPTPEPIATTDVVDDEEWEDDEESPTPADADSDESIC